MDKKRNSKVFKQELKTEKSISLEEIDLIQNLSNDKISFIEIDDSENSNDKLNNFINKIKDKDERESCFNKIDNHVTQLLDSVKLKEKKRKNTKSLGDQNMLEKIDLTSSDSILTQINMKNVFNLKTFNSFPLYYQYKLIKLLPKCDQITTPEGWVKISSTALSNEFFTKAHQIWLKRLSESKFSLDYIQKNKIEIVKDLQKLDPWKAKHFEPIWNKPLKSFKYFNNLDNSSDNKNETIDDSFSYQEQFDCEIIVEDSDSNFNSAQIENSVSNNEKLNHNCLNCSINSTNITNNLALKEDITCIDISSQNSLPNDSFTYLQTDKLKIKKLNSTLDEVNEERSSIICQNVVQKSPNKKMFYISNHGKIFQVQSNEENSYLNDFNEDKTCINKKKYRKRKSSNSIQINEDSKNFVNYINVDNLPNNFNLTSTNGYVQKVRTIKKVDVSNQNIILNPYQVNLNGLDSTNILNVNKLKSDQIVKNNKIVATKTCEYIINPLPKKDKINLQNNQRLINGLNSENNLQTEVNSKLIKIEPIKPEYIKINTPISQINMPIDTNSNSTLKLNESLDEEIICSCEGKPMIICSRCSSYNHFECIGQSKICNNCLKQPY